MRIKNLLADVGDRVALQEPDDVLEGLVIGYGPGADELEVQIDGEVDTRCIRSLYLQRMQ